jgi:NAD+ dependent glucose-6-phosphate dehydrogenase
MRVLITGADSLLGRALAQQLHSQVELRLVDSQLPASTSAVDARAGDLRDLDFVREIMQGIDAVVHLAPLATRMASEQDSLDHATRGAYALADAAAKANAQRIVLGSSLRLFPPEITSRYRVDESWRPRPQTDLDSLCAWLSEVCLRETVRITGTPTMCLRLGDVTDDASVAGKPFDPYWVHVEDAVAAIKLALEVELPGWGVVHVGAAGKQAASPNTTAGRDAFPYAPKHDFAANAAVQLSTTHVSLIAPRPIKRVVIFGAGGPLAAATAETLSSAYILRLTDVKPIDELLATMTPQSPGAPLPVTPQPPHEWRVVDVCDAEQVMAACEGMDAIINCTVIRNDLAGAFRVNMLGAWNVMRAAVARGIHRVVHTGPYMLGDRGSYGYDWDYGIVDDVPPRPGTSWLYFMSKLCGQEIARIYAQQHGLSVPTLTFCSFRNPDAPTGYPIHPLTVSWRDASRAIRCALEVQTLPSPFEYFHIGADLPHDVYSNEKAKRLLKWQPQDTFERDYARS